MKALLAWTGGLFALVVVCGCLGEGLPGEVLFHLAAGWIFFLRRVLPVTTLDTAGWFTAAVSVLLLAVGIHRIGRWLVGQQNSTHAWQRRWTLIVLAIFVLMFIAGLAVVGLTHQTAWWITSHERIATHIREAGPRTISMNNLKQIGMVMHSTADAKGHFPPGATFDRNGTALHGWHTFMLPFLEQAGDYKAIQLHLPWHHPVNAEPCKQEIPEYQISTQLDANGYSLTCYYANVHLFAGEQRYDPKTIPDGSSNTILAGEAGTNLKPWAHAPNWRDPARGINKHPDGFGTAPGVRGRGAAILMADGSVCIMSDQASLAAMKALGTPADRTAVSLNEVLGP